MQALKVRRAAAIVAFLLFALVGADPSWADIDNDRYESGKPWFVGISGPANWRMNEQASYTSTCIKVRSSDEGRPRECERSDQRYTYSSILLWMHRRSPGGKMLLAVEKLEERMTSLEYANKTRELLDKLGFEVRIPQLHAATGAYWLEFDNGKRFLRQAVLVNGSIGYSLTLAASSSRDRASHLRAFDFALRSIRIDRDRSSKALSPDAGKDGDPSENTPGDKADDKAATGDKSAGDKSAGDKSAGDKSAGDKNTGSGKDAGENRDSGSRTDGPRKDRP